MLENGDDEKKTAGKAKVIVNRLKTAKQKVNDVTDKEAQKVRGGMPAQDYIRRRYI